MAAAAVTVSVSSTVGVGSRSPSLRSRLATTSTSFLSSWTWFSSKTKVGYHPLQRRTALPARKTAVRAARTESKGVSLGFRAPDFQLTEPLTGKVWTLEDFDSYPALLVMFICNHCPFVIHLKKDIKKLANFYMKKGLAVVAISSNSVVTHPQDGPELMAEEAKLFNYPFPYLYDEVCYFQLHPVLCFRPPLYFPQTHCCPHLFSLTQTTLISKLQPPISVNYLE